MQVLGIYIHNSDKKILKNLKENTWYPFINIENCEGIFSSKKEYERIKNSLKESNFFVQRLYRWKPKEKSESRTPLINREIF